jgi:hypothetical protein
MSTAGIEDTNILQVTQEDVDYFHHFKPVHYLTLKAMIENGEAEIINKSSGT